MKISDHIARLIEKMLDEGDGITEVKRNDLAMRLGCVPSQVTYVISSRFTPDRGYMTESRRGGGGCIRIVRVNLSKDEYLMHFFHAIGENIDEGTALAYLSNLRDNNVIGDGTRKIMASAMIGSVLDRVPVYERNKIRADIFRHMIMALMH